MADADLLIKVGTTPKDPFADIKESLKDIDKGIGAATSGFKGLGASVATVAAIGKTFDFILDATREMQDLQTQFIAFTGSAKGAADQMDRLSEFASKSPFSLAEVAQANKTLLAFGSSTSQSMEQLRQLGEVSAATGKDLSDLATIFGQIQAEGKLTGERFQQLIERGVNLGPLIAQSMGIAETSVKKFSSEGKISADVVSEAFRKMTSEGGQFFGSTERLSKTISGSISSLSDNFKILASTVGSDASPAFTGFVNILNRAVEGNIAYLKEQQKIANETEVQKRIRAIGEEITGLDGQLKDLKKTQSEGFKFFGDDQIELAAKIDAITTSVRTLAQERLKLIKQEGIAESLKKDAEDADKAAKDKKKADDDRRAKLLEAEKKRQEDEQKAAEDRAKKILETEKQITEITLQETAVRSAKADLISQQSAARAAEQKQAETAKRLEMEAIELEGVAGMRTNADIAEQERQAALNEATRKAQLDAVLQRETEITSQKVQAEATRQELLGAYAQAEVLREQDTQKKIADTQKKAEADRLAVLRKAQKDEFDLELQTQQAKKNFDEQTYAQRVATAQTGLNALSGLMRSKNREAFEVGKAAATAQALIAIPATAIEAYKSLAGVPVVGPALGAAAAAAAVIAGTEQLRNIQNTRMAFSEGGLVPGIGNKDTVPALLTPGEVVVPKTNYSDLQNGIGGGMEDQIMLLKAGNAIAGKILDQLSYGLIIEKMTTMISMLDSIKTSSANTANGIFGTGGSRDHVSTFPPEFTDVYEKVNVEINRSRPQNEKPRQEKQTEEQGRR